MISGFQILSQNKTRFEQKVQHTAQIGQDHLSRREKRGERARQGKYGQQTSSTERAASGSSVKEKEKGHWKRENVNHGFHRRIQETWLRKAQMPQ